MVVYISFTILMFIALCSLFKDIRSYKKGKQVDILSSVVVLIAALLLLIFGVYLNA
ncbi:MULTISPECIES: hypothetical protein [Staphylococcus]|uniref:hypothetical protein n=1 Tax=Staphylococcus TaxID=1279 RepID=UPI00208FBDD4|nr:MULTISPECIES: hypothetical protein [Staphylococcus]MCO4332710.1 hypothetical protein [Staphylococcus hyicus]MCO4335133.1 hypothetical protein [Staphylococcus hyicus]MCO4351545.1 hypothetical protein [Staphylococcus agnetis]